MIALDKLIQIIRLCSDSIIIGIGIGSIFLGWNICYYLILDVFLLWTACLQNSHWICVQRIPYLSRTLQQGHSLCRCSLWCTHQHRSRLTQHHIRFHCRHRRIPSDTPYRIRAEIKGVCALIAFLKSYIYFIVFNKSDDWHVWHVRWFFCVKTTISSSSSAISNSISQLSLTFSLSTKSVW